MSTYSSVVVIQVACALGRPRLKAAVLEGSIEAAKVHAQLLARGTMSSQLG